MKTPAETHTTVEGEGCRASLLPSRVPYAAAPISRCKTRLHASTGRRETSIHPGEATTKSKYDAFNKGATTTTPPSHIHNGPGFHPWTSTLGGYTTPPAGKAAPNGVAAAKTFAQDPTSANVGPRSRTPPNPSPSNAAVPPPHGGLIRGQRRVGCTRQPHSRVDCHVIIIITN